MATGAFHDIDLPQESARTQATLLSVARPIPNEALTRAGVNRFIAGVEWLPAPDVVVNAQPANCDVTFDKLPRDLPGLADQPAFVLWDSLRCSANGRHGAMLAGHLNAEFTDFLSPMFASELETAAGSGGLGLDDASATVVTTGVANLALGLAQLEDYLAFGSGKPGMLGVIHLTPGLLNIAVAAGLIHMVGDGFETWTGHRVVADAGHRGTTGPSAVAAGTGNAWIYATGTVWYAKSGIEGVLKVEGPDGGAYYQPRNEDRPLAEIYGLIVFDPAILGAARVSVAMP